MSETTPTLGSTEGTQYEREQFAKNSLRFNIKNETFKELFPDIVKEIEAKLNAQKAIDGTGGVDADSTDNGNSGGASNRNNSSDSTTWQSLCSNLIVLTGFAIFALIVNHVIKNLNQE